ncbi:MAG: CHASE2 domain-containing protein [Alphaproteobacteria bacterium]
MGRMSRRDISAAAAIALVTGIAVASPGFEFLRGLSIDALTALRWQVFPKTHDPEPSQVVVVAIDEQTYRTPPFDGTPSVTWTREIGRTLTALIDGGAKVVGFDIVFPTSIEQSQIPFGDDTLGTKVRGFDRDYLRALAAAARAGKLVLGQVQHGDHPIMPSPGQRIAVDQQRNIRPLNLFSDPDGVVRRVPLGFSVDGASVPSMSVELVARALGDAPKVTPDGALTLGGYLVPAIVANTLTLNFNGAAEAVPTFSLADLRACLEKGDMDFFRRNFAGKIVLIGAVLDVEDRKITSKRFAATGEPSRGPRCALPSPPETMKFARDTIPGVYVHATAVSNLLRRDALSELSRVWIGAAAVALSGLTVAAALLLSPVGATLVFAGLALVWTSAGIAAFRYAVALPLVEPMLAGLVALAAAIGFRLVIADKDKRFLRRSFTLYLAPAVVEKLVASNAPPALGGETRHVTAYFSDVAGFSTLSESLSPAETVALMNEYLSAMTEIIEEHGGFVDKYIGDAIVAVFGAPVDDPAHASNAVRAALRCRQRLEELNRSATAFEGRRLHQRIGLNSGDALVGNIGSYRRFNYTVMGDMVNLAARLEGANKYFGTSIMASEATVALVGSEIAWRELDSIRVKGRSAAVKIYEPLAVTGAETADQAARAASYAEGLACWRARDFKGAADAFARFAAVDPAAAIFQKRAAKFALEPPGAEWEPVNTLEEK